MACPATGQVETENRLPQIARHIAGMGACRAPSGPKRPHLNFTGCLASMHSPLDTIEFATKSAGTHLYGRFEISRQYCRRTQGVNRRASSCILPTGSQSHRRRDRNGDGPTRPKRSRFYFAAGHSLTCELVLHLRASRSNASALCPGGTGQASYEGLSLRRLCASPQPKSLTNRRRLVTDIQP
jgi:hypothetical protein